MIKSTMSIMTWLYFISLTNISQFESETQAISPKTLPECLNRSKDFCRWTKCLKYSAICSKFIDQAHNFLTLIQLTIHCKLASYICMQYQALKTVTRSTAIVSFRLVKDMVLTRHSLSFTFAIRKSKGNRSLNKSKVWERNNNLRL